MVRVWDRKTLQLHRTLRGHEGPVNAVGLQSGKVVRLTVTEPFLCNSLTDAFLGQRKWRWKDDPVGYR